MFSKRDLLGTEWFAQESAIEQARRFIEPRVSAAVPLYEQAETILRTAGLPAIVHDQAAKVLAAHALSSPNLDSVHSSIAEALAAQQRLTPVERAKIDGFAGDLLKNFSLYHNAVATPSWAEGDRFDALWRDGRGSDALWRQITRSQLGLVDHVPDHVKEFLAGGSLKEAAGGSLSAVERHAAAEIARVSRMWSDHAPYREAYREIAELGDALRGHDVIASAAAFARTFGDPARMSWGDALSFTALEQERALRDAGLSAALLATSLPAFELMLRVEGFPDPTRWIRQRGIWHRKPSATWAKQMLAKYRPNRHFASAQRKLAAFEMFLRDALAYLLEELYGPEWFDAGVPASIAARARNRARSDQGRLLLEEVDFGHYVRIVRHGPNWDAVFEPIFGDAEDVRSKFVLLNQLRRRIAHNKLHFGKADAIALRGVIAWFMKALSWRQDVLGEAKPFDVDISEDS